MNLVVNIDPLPSTGYK